MQFLEKVATRSVNFWNMLVIRLKLTVERKELTRSKPNKKRIR